MGILHTTPSRAAELAGDRIMAAQEAADNLAESKQAFIESYIDEHYEAKAHDGLFVSLAIANAPEVLERKLHCSLALGFATGSLELVPQQIESMVRYALIAPATEAWDDLVSEPQGWDCVD